MLNFEILDLVRERHLNGYTVIKFKEINTGVEGSVQMQNGTSRELIKEEMIKTYERYCEALNPLREGEIL